MWVIKNAAVTIKLKYAKCPLWRQLRSMCVVLLTHCKLLRETSVAVPRFALQNVVQALCVVSCAQNSVWPPSTEPQWAKHFLTWSTLDNTPEGTFLNSCWIYSIYNLQSFGPLILKFVFSQAESAPCVKNSKYLLFDIHTHLSHVRQYFHVFPSDA